MAIWTPDELASLRELAELLREEGIRKISTQIRGRHLELEMAVVKNPVEEARQREAEKKAATTKTDEQRRAEEARAAHSDWRDAIGNSEPVLRKGPVKS